MLKRIAKRLVSADHWQFLGWYKSHFGFLAAMLGFAGLLLDEGMCRAPKTLTSHPVFLRPGTADQDVFDEIFIDRAYDLDLGKPKFIVDAGAHIGLSSVFFANKYPEATVVAIEPEPSNFGMLLMNTRKYTNIRPIRAGLWGHKAHLQILDSSVANWAFRVSEDPSGQGIQAIGISDVMAEFDAARIDILKMDIEGSELEVLNHPSWIDAVGTLIIELHDRFQPGCSEALARALSGHHYDQSQAGENIVITNLRRIVT